MTCPRPPIVVAAALVAASVLLAGLALAGQDPSTDPDGAAGRVTLSIVGTTDLHGRVFPNGGRGGLALLGGYLRNLRAAREADGGAVLLLDAGDTFEGGIASNISEGALVVDAYNALGYGALAIGNHEFDYGALDIASADGGTLDMRGALKAAAARARFPFLAANLIDASAAGCGWRGLPRRLPSCSSAITWATSTFRSWLPAPTHGSSPRWKCVHGRSSESSAVRWVPSS